MSNSNQGEWLLTVVDANVVKGFDLFTKSDLYVQIRVGDKLFKTKTCKNENYPIWNESVSFPMNNSSNIEIKVLDNDLFKDDKIAVANIYYNQFPNQFGEEKEYSIPLSFQNRDVGILHIRIRNNVGNQQQSFLNDRSNMAQSNYNQTYHDTGGYNTTPLGGHSHPDNNNNNTRVLNEQYNEQHNEHHKEHHKHKDKKDKDKKHKHQHHEPKVILPEKHHHYEDGLTSSSSEESNDGERRRAAEGKLGTYAYAAPLDNNDPYINNTFNVQSNRLNNPNVNNPNVNNPNVNNPNLNNPNLNNQNPNLNYQHPNVNNPNLNYQNPNLNNANLNNPSLNHPNLNNPNLNNPNSQHVYHDNRAL